jgi:catechol 2,3-dioxygenase-like lactoylglutathione lyase family enzyme
MAKPWEVSHIAYAVDDLDVWMERYGRALGGRWTHILEFDTEWRSVLTNEVRNVIGRSAWLTGQNPPLELWEGGEGSPFVVPRGGHELHHIGYWGDDLPDMVNRLMSIGYQLEHTPLASAEHPPTDGEYRGFAYMLAPGGIRVEVHSGSYREGVTRWLAGGPRWLPGDAAAPPNTR